MSQVWGLTLHRLLQGRPTWQVFARPMFAIGIVCPAVLTGLAVFHQLASVQRELDPIGTLTSSQPLSSTSISLMY